MPVTRAPIDRRVFDAQTLMSRPPPRWHHPNKLVVYEIACPAGSVHRGQVEYSRWSAMDIPEWLVVGAAGSHVESREDIYDYRPSDEETIQWHVNFADPELFIAYRTGLFAQDEMQVAEHPALGALREELERAGFSTRTVEDDRPTPILVKGVERRCHVATEPAPANGRPSGLYGNAFSAASAETVLRATRRLAPPTVTNLIAMAAPVGSGRYTSEQVEYILGTAYTGFRAAQEESDGAAAVVHTGYWGCGAFGGNRELMAMLQVLAAQVAGIERLVFHTVTPAGSKSLRSSMEIVEARFAGRQESRDLIRRIVALGYEWGTSNGT